MLSYNSRPASYMDLWEEIKTKVVGPMYVNEFLDAFLPPAASGHKLTGPDKEALENLSNVTEEFPMYEAFINAFEKPVESHLKFWDGHATPMKAMSGTVIQPDLCIVDDESRNLVGNPNHAVKLENVGITIEMKYNTLDNPFKERAKQFQRTTRTACYTFGQICAYATAHMASQFRTHVFSILVFPDGARLFRWDRAGVIVTEKIPFSSPEVAKPMSQFFLRYALATKTQRGVDTSAQRLSADEVFCLPLNIKQSLQIVPDAASVYRLSFPSRGQQNEEAKTYVVAAPCYMGTPSPTGRSTRGFKAFCEQTGKEVFLQDTWRVLDGSLIPEHEAYVKLKRAGVNYVATMLDYFDFEDQETQTTSCLRYYDEGKFGPHLFRTFRHYRFVLDKYAKPIAEFDDVRQLVQVMRDALQAHREAHDDAHILHRDISPGNIMIDSKGRGVLLDWDQSRSTETESMETPNAEVLPERTGTWQFISCRLSARLEKGQPLPRHDRDDDIESFWFVFYWVALIRCERGHAVWDVSKHIRSFFDINYESEEVSHFSTGYRESALWNKRLLNKIPFVSETLNSILREFQSVISQRYRTPDPEKRKILGELWEATLQEFRDKGEIPNPFDLDDVYNKRIRRRREIEPDTAPARFLARNTWPEEILERYLEPGKLLDPINTLDVVDVSAVDWVTGNKNVENTDIIINVPSL